LQRFVYARMDDFLRKVSAHVSIGRAWRNHKVTDNYFVLCREG
jgi:phosphodiesterase/alkaline phosphatase D-like protein